MRLLLYPIVWLVLALLGTAAGLALAALLVTAFTYKLLKEAFLHFFWPAQRHSLRLLQQWQLRA